MAELLWCSGGIVTNGNQAMKPTFSRRKFLTDEITYTSR